MVLISHSIGELVLAITKFMIFFILFDKLLLVKRLYHMVYHCQLPTHYTVMESSINLFVGHSFLFLFFLTAQFGLHFEDYGTI